MKVQLKDINICYPNCGKMHKNANPVRAQAINELNLSLDMQTKCCDAKTIFAQP